MGLRISFPSSGCLLPSSVETISVNRNLFYQFLCLLESSLLQDWFFQYHSSLLNCEMETISMLTHDHDVKISIMVNDIISLILLFIFKLVQYCENFILITLSVIFAIARARKYSISNLSTKSFGFCRDQSLSAACSATSL